MALTLASQLKQLSPDVRALVEAAISAVRSAGPDADEVLYDSRRPASPSAMWKLTRYRSGGDWVAGVGAFTRHASLFLYRGRELSDPAGLLQGSGRDTRFVPIRTVDDVGRPEVAALLREAFSL